MAIILNVHIHNLHIDLEVTCTINVNILSNSGTA